MSMKRAGRPAWAVLATAVLFIFTTVAATLISRHKTIQAEIIMGEVRPYLALNLQAGFPVGWEVSEVERINSVQVVLAVPPDRLADRRLFLFRIRPTWLGPQSPSRAPALAIRSLDPRSRTGNPEPLGKATIGDLPSAFYQLAVYSPVMGVELQPALANVAVTPDRHLLGVLLVVNGALTNRDHRLVNEVSRTISYRAGSAEPDESDSFEDTEDTFGEPRYAPRPAGDLL
jgi:hypothetical protein